MLDFIMSRRSTRSFQDVPVEPEKLDQVIEAGRYAATGGNSQTSHFLVIRNKEVLEELRVLVEKLFSGMEETPGMYKSKAAAIRRAKAGNYHFHYDAPVLILMANQRDYGNNIADVACCLENMMLMANALDLGSVWINQVKWLNEEPEMISLLQKIGMKDSERVYGGLSLGYAKTEDGLPNRILLERHGNVVTYID